MVTKKIAQLDASDLDRVARYKSTHAQWDVHVSGPLLAIRHLDRMGAGASSRM